MPPELIRPVYSRDLLTDIRSKGTTLCELEPMEFELDSRNRVFLVLCGVSFRCCQSRKLGSCAGKGDVLLESFGILSFVPFSSADDARKLLGVTPPLNMYMLAASGLWRLCVTCMTRHGTFN